MPIVKEKTTAGITLRVTAYHNCDDVELFWRVRDATGEDKSIPNCLGFIIERRRLDPDGNWGPVEVLRNQVGFGTTQAAPNASGYRSEPAHTWPFQCYDWTDHGANNGQNVKYRVSAVGLPAAGGIPGEIKLATIAHSGWTAAIKVEAYSGAASSAYFNRGAVMSQYVARQARINNWGPKDIKAKIKDLQEPLRRFLSGELRLALLGLLDEVIDDPSLELYAALYELSDAELIARLKLLRGRAHIILSNRYNQSGDGNLSPALSWTMQTLTCRIGCSAAKA